MSLGRLSPAAFALLLAAALAAPQSAGAEGECDASKASDDEAALLQVRNSGDAASNATTNASSKGNASSRGNASSKASSKRRARFTPAAGSIMPDDRWMTRDDCFINGYYDMGQKSEVLYAQYAMADVYTAKIMCVNKQGCAGFSFYYDGAGNMHVYYGTASDSNGFGCVDGTGWTTVMQCHEPQCTPTPSPTTVTWVPDTPSPTTVTWVPDTPSPTTVTWVPDTPSPTTVTYVPDACQDYAPGWTDGADDCAAYAAYSDSPTDGWCAAYGATVGPDGITAQEACCACGGGVTIPAGRPYLVQGQSFVASSPPGEGPTAAGGWGAPDERLSCVQHGDGLAARLLAEANRRAQQVVHGAQDMEPLLALQGTTTVPEERLSGLIRSAKRELSAAEPTELERWRGAGLNEHASVGTFAKLGMELMVAGAPPRLARLAARAQEEEVLHAHISLALGGAREGGELLEFPEHKLELTRDKGALHRAAIAEGLRGEGRASLELFDQAVESLRRRPAVAQLCWMMAMDEARHAELAEETLRWLQRTAGMPAPRVELGAHGVKVSEVVQSA